MRATSLATLMICVLAVLAGAGCKSIGPGTVRRDRMRYATAVADSRNEQLLLNIVKARFADAPSFLEVASVVGGYSLETGVNLNGQFSPQSLRGDTFAAGGVAGKFTDRPTISYSPMTGERFARSLLAPVPLDALMFVIQGGTPADFILGLTAQSIEGYHNVSVAGGKFQPANPKFLRLLQLLRALQQADVSESRIMDSDDRVAVWIQLAKTETLEPTVAEQLAEVKALLGVPAQLDRMDITFGNFNPEPGAIGVRTRSLLQIMNTLSAGVDIPQDSPVWSEVFPVDSSLVPKSFIVHCGKERPEEAFVAVSYANLWFWIDRRDLVSKTTLAAVALLFNFLQGDGKIAPVLTIPTN